MSPKKRFKWSSHNPVITAGLKLLKPEFALELGIGNYSTPLFLESGIEKIVHIENDKSWLDHIQLTYQTDARSEFHHHDLGPGINKATQWNALPQDCQMACIRYYSDLSAVLSSNTFRSRLLFVDHYTCLRALAINMLSAHFDFVIYHDAENPEIYGYDSLRSDLLDQFDHFLLKTSSSWTGFFIRKNSLDLQEAKLVLTDETEAFLQKFGKVPDEFVLEQL